MKLARLLVIFGFARLLTSLVYGESITFREVPAKLPQGITLGKYSPPVGIDYSGLQSGNYTLAAWLLVPGPWYGASSVWFNRAFTINNSSGTNSSGTRWFADNMDVYSYGQFDWIFRLFDSNGVQVGFAEQFISATANQPPILAPIGNQTGVTGQPLTFKLTATDPEAQLIRFGATNLPPGATLNATKGIFTWTPTNEGTFGPVVFWVEDSGDGQLRDAEIVNFTIQNAPIITLQPSNQVAIPGTTVNLSVNATSSSPITFQWRLNGTNMASATNSVLTLTNLSTNQAGGYSVMVSNSVGSVLSQDAVLTIIVSRTPVESLAFSLQWLRDRMDETHQGYQVYTDISAAGNHFHARGQLPDQHSSVGIFGSSTNRPHSGATCIQCTFTNVSGATYGGFYFLNGILISNAPLPYFGSNQVDGTSIAVSNFTGLDLSGAQQLTFWARGENGGEKIEFFMGGVGHDPDTGLPNQPFPDSTPRISVPGTRVVLTTNWQQFAINVTGANLTNIMGGFGWIAAGDLNPTGATFYLDDIVYQLSPARQTQRLSEPRFIRSFKTKPVQPNVEDSNLDDDIDLVLRNVAFIYDNALALLAFLADGSPDSLQRARLIADAIVYALTHDRTYTDGRVRTSYQAGDIALPLGWMVNGKNGTATVPGFYLENPPHFTEVENVDVDTGNNAWAMIALLGAHRQFGGTNYLAAARRIGEFIQTTRVEGGSFPGFRGGIANAEGTNALPRTYVSTEHNLDIHAAFAEMYRLTGETQWQNGSSLAFQFIESMWDPGQGCFLTGTTGTSPDFRNTEPHQLPVDTQTWNVLAITNALQLRPALLSCVELHHRNQSDGFDGADFNNDRDGVWLEGSGQLAVAYAFAQNFSRVNQLRATLQAAQQIPAPYGDGMGTPAASHDGVTSGFYGFNLFRRPHVGATAWNIFAQMGFNPYYGTRSPVVVTSNGFDATKRFHLHVIGEPGKNHVLERTANLYQWNSVATNSSPYGEMEFIDSESPTDKVSIYRISRNSSP